MKRDAAALPTTFPTPAGAVTAARTSARATSSIPTQRGRSRRAAERPAPLGSLLTAGARSTAQVTACAACTGTSLTQLPMTLTDGRAVTFVSCHDCEAKGWFGADGGALPLDVVLASAARD